MATTPVLLSMEEYLRTSFHPDADYVEGEIEERNLGEYEHARLQFLLAGFFAPREKNWSVQGVIEQRILVTSTRVRIADFALLRAAGPREKITATAPLLCIEILSPEDRLSRAKEVLADYLAMGVENIWLIDPIRRSAFTFDATGLHEADPMQLKIAGTSIHLDLTEAFAAID